MELLSFVEFAIIASVQDISGVNPQQLVFGQVLWDPGDLVDGLHAIEAVQSWVFEV